MIYVVRNRYKESLKPADFAKVNDLLDRKIIPSMERIKGVRSLRAFNSFGGEIVLLVEIDELAAIDRALVDERYNRIASEMFDYLVRVGGDVWFDRGSWQQCYGHKPKKGSKTKTRRRK
jgi:hypothetical protein